MLDAITLVKPGAKKPGRTKVQKKVMGLPLPLFLLLGSLLLGIISVWGGIITGLLILIAIVGLPVIYALLVYPKFGIVVLLVAAYFIMLFTKLTKEFPLGTVMDILEYLLIIGFFIKQKYRNDWTVFKNPISYFILAWIIYNFMEVANPSAVSVLAWVYTVRTVAIVMFMYFIFVFHINDVAFIKLIIRLWLGLALFAAVYGFIQEHNHNGYFSFEWTWLRKNPVSMQLYYIQGHWRKFSIFSDPVTFAYNMAVAIIMCISLMLGPIKKSKKIRLAIMAAFCTLSMLYSGTRGAYVLIPASLVMLAVMNFNRTVLIASLAGAAFLAIVILMPTSNPIVLRFQSAFKPSDDASFNVRAQNQARIKPYILAHPIGGGLGSVGIWGLRFAPNSELAKFPPDSGYVRVAVEMGWIGLLLFCMLIFTVLYTGINNFFLIKDPTLKNYCMCMTLVVFTFNVGNYPQQAIVQFPSSILFYLAMALIVVLKRVDQQLQHQKSKENSLINS